MKLPAQKAIARYDLLDAWRGLACLLVVLVHSTHYAAYHRPSSLSGVGSWVIAATTYGAVGVPIFFVISGYCIAASADSSRRRGHSTRSFFLRRFRRIFPPYLIFIGLLAIIVTLVGLFDPTLFGDSLHPIREPWTFTFWQTTGNLTLTGGWLGYVVREPGKWFLLPAWTLGYEEQFYAVVGVLLLLWPRRLFAGVVVVSVAVLAIRNLVPPGFFFDGYWLHFAAGVLVYYAAVYTSGQRRYLCYLLLVAGLVAALWWPLRDQKDELTRRSFDLVAFSTALVMLALRRWDGRLVNSWAVRPFARCGVMCYSVYLVHWPVCKLISHVLWRGGVTDPTATVLFTLPLCILGSLAVAAVFYRCVERRFLNSSSRASPSRLAADTGESERADSVERIDKAEEPELGQTPQRLSPLPASVQ